MPKEFVFYNEKKVEIVLSSEDIQLRVLELAKKITTDYKDKELVCIGVLKGVFLFFADLVRNINVDLQIDFIRVKSYEQQSSSGVVDLINDISLDLANKDILLIEDIVDTGNTVTYLTKYLATKNIASLKIASFLSKPEVLKQNNFSTRIDYLGFEIANEFVVGYGLDYDQKFRNCPHLCKMG